jgi:hypothetical protein
MVLMTGLENFTISSRIKRAPESGLRERPQWVGLCREHRVEERTLLPRVEVVRDSGCRPEACI